MGISTVTRVLAVCLLCIGLAMSTGCGGDNGSDEVVLVPDSTIQGNVAQVVAALQAPRAQPTYWARWQEFFRLVPTVQAQQTGNLAGIVVVARQGTLLATTTTDATGNFILRVASGAATLTFTTATFTVSTNLSIPANSSVVLVVSLKPPTQVVVLTQVVVAEGLLTLSPIRCTEGTVELPDGLAPGDITIDGGGEDCLRAEGQCTIDLQLGTRSLTLTNCERCIRAVGNADVHLITTTSTETPTDKNPISCKASEDGILAQGTASITLETAELSIMAGEHGVHASGTAEVVLKVPTCTITGTEGPTRIDGNATIDGCDVPPAEVALSPIRCTGGTVQLPAGLPPGDITIDGGGEDCLRAEGQCTIDLQLGTRGLTLTNCERCIRAVGNADVHLITTTSTETPTDKNPISCKASEDGILAQGTASITLETAELSITAGEHGVHASGTAEVVLKVPTCSITGTEGPTRIDGNATIDGCGVPPAEVALSPIRCTGGTVQLPAGLPPGDITIDGGGEDCLRAEGQCTIDLQLGTRGLTLTNCERCIRAVGNADVHLITTTSTETPTDKNPISCKASEDGILAQGTASITLETAELSITAGEHGVHASGTAEVVLTVPVPACSITGTEGPVRIDGNATIDDCRF